ncbi:MAG: hypothetical protein GX640_09730 [Fibrobacter sp.]|nr:hypothetical protein [Fibrobacter sp.]
MKMRKIAILLVLTVFVFAGDKKEQQEKTDIIKKYIVNEQMRYMSDGFFQKQINDSRDDFPNVPDSVWKEVYDSVNQKETFLNYAIDIYASQFSLDELREIKKAFEMPAVKKLMSGAGDDSEKFGLMGVKCGKAICDTIVQYLEKKKYVVRSSSPKKDQ